MQKITTSMHVPNWNIELKSSRIDNNKLKKCTSKLVCIFIRMREYFIKFPTTCETRKKR